LTWTNFEEKHITNTNVVLTQHSDCNTEKIQMTTMEVNCTRATTRRLKREIDN